MEKESKIIIFLNVSQVLKNLRPLNFLISFLERAYCEYIVYYVY